MGRCWEWAPGLPLMPFYPGLLNSDKPALRSPSPSPTIWRRGEVEKQEVQEQDSGREQVEVKFTNNGSSGVQRARTGSLSVSRAPWEHVSEDRKRETKGEEGELLGDLIVVSCYCCRDGMLCNVQLTCSVYLVHMLTCVCMESLSSSGVRQPQCKCVNGYQQGIATQARYLKRGQWFIIAGPVWWMTSCLCQSCMAVFTSRNECGQMWWKGGSLSSLDVMGVFVWGGWEPCCRKKRSEWAGEGGDIAEAKVIYVLCSVFENRTAGWLVFLYVEKMYCSLHNHGLDSLYTPQMPLQIRVKHAIVYQKVLFIESWLSFLPVCAITLNVPM